MSRIDNVGGLFRCCIHMIQEHEQESTREPLEGEVLMCKACHKLVIFRHGHWRWFP